MTPDAIELMSKERPYALDILKTQLLYDIAGMMNEQGEEIINFRQDFRSTIPKGKFEPLTLNITNAVTKLSPSSINTMPWFSFTIYNDGPDPVYMMVNEDFLQQRTPLNNGENLAVNMGKDQIETVLLFCLAGNNAGVRIFAIQ